MRKVSELEGAELDYWVARAEGEPAIFEHDTCKYHYDDRNGTWEPGWFPSANWSQGGPIIERENIGSMPPYGLRDGWNAAIDAGNAVFSMDGPTLLIAAMRCYVASKFGDEVNE